MDFYKQRSATLPMWKKNFRAHANIVDNEQKTLELLHLRRSFVESSENLMQF